MLRPASLIALLLMLTACGDPQQRALQDLTARGFSLSVADFHQAAAKGDVQALDAFLRAGTSIDVPDKKGDTAFIQAIRARQTAAAEWLVQHGAARTSTSESMILLATRSGDAKLTQLVLPEHDHAQNDAAQISTAILEHAQITTAILEAAQNGLAEPLEVLLTAKPAPAAATLDKALLSAAQNGHIECIDTLLQAGADPDTRQPTSGLTPLHFAVQNDHIPAASMLVQNGASRLALTAESKSIWQLGAVSTGMAALLTKPEKPAAPPPRITAADIHGTLTLVETHLTPLPILFTATDGRVAVFTHTSQELHVRPEEIISDTTWRLDALITQSDIMPAWTLPHVILTDTRSGQHHLLIQGQPTLATPHSATVQILNSDSLFDCRSGDAFQLNDKPHTITEITRHHLIYSDPKGQHITLNLH